MRELRTDIYEYGINSIIGTVASIISERVLDDSTMLYITYHYDWDNPTTIYTREFDKDHTNALKYALDHKIYLRVSTSPTKKVK